MTTSALCLKGRQGEFGPRLEWARDVVYVGRRCTQGGWKLSASPYANPHRAQRVGGAARAVAMYRADLRWQPELIARARRELPGKRLACFCERADDPRLCHAGLWVVIVTADVRDLTHVLGGAIGAQP